MTHEGLFWWGGWLLPTSAMLLWLPGVLLLIPVRKTVHNKSPALQGGIICSRKGAAQNQETYTGHLHVVI